MWIASNYIAEHDTDLTPMPLCLLACLRINALLSPCFMTVNLSLLSQSASCNPFDMAALILFTKRKHEHYLANLSSKKGSNSCFLLICSTAAAVCFCCRCVAIVSDKSLFLKHVNRCEQRIEQAIEALIGLI